jgi:branched-chain amino acid transport system permease protein
MDQFINQFSFLMVNMVFNALLALSLYLPLMAGQLSLASPGFYAVGGYVAAVMSTQVFADTPADGLFPLQYVFIEMVLAGVICGFLALIIGVPSLRLRGMYLALATIAFVEIVRVVSLNLEITGGAIGIFGIPQPFDTKFEYMWIALPLLLLTMVFVLQLERSRTGQALSALREDELAATAMGINPTYHKVLAFVLGAVLAGMVGAVNAHFLNTWNARQGTFDVSVLILAYVIVGGARSYVGPVLGAFLLTALPEALRYAGDIPGIPVAVAAFLKEGRLIIFGLLIAFGSQFFPQGLISADWFRRQPKPSDKKAQVQEKAA